MNRKTIPIFPLDLVLFPRQELPLRIFEPRYKQLIDDCMVNDGQFGVCLIEPNNSIVGWDAPMRIGTIAKIIECKDVELDGMQLQIETVGRNKFQILKIIPPPIEQPQNYNPYTLEGHKIVSALHERAGVEEKMYIQAEVEMILEIDEHVPVVEWESIVNMWKNKIITQSLPQTIESYTLDRVLEQYYLVTDAPTIDYIYSLSALGAKEPADLQPILEANTMSDLISRVKELMTVK